MFMHNVTQAWIGHQKKSIIANIRDTLELFAKHRKKFVKIIAKRHDIIVNVCDNYRKYLLSFTNNCDLSRIIMTNHEYSQ